MMKSFWLCLAALACFCTPAWATTVNIPGFEQQTFTNATGAWIVRDVVDTPDGSEAVGVVYLISTLGTGEFSGKSNDIAILTANQGWFFIPPTSGMTVYDQTGNVSYFYNGTTWETGTSGGGGSSAQLTVSPDLTTKDWSTASWLQFCGYYSCSDGGGGLFKKVDCGTTDNGYCILDSAGNKWQRQNINGDIRQYGVTTGSVFDCEPVANGGVGVSSCQGAGARIANMQTAAEAFSLTRLTSAGMNIRLGSTFGNVTIDPNMELDCGGQNVSVGLNVPGTIWTDDHVHLIGSKRSWIHHCLQMPIWFGQTYAASPGNLHDNYVAVQTMTSKGDTGAVCGGVGCRITDGAIAGYDTGIEVTNSAPDMSNMQVDANVCFYYHNSGGNATWYDPTCKSALPSSAFAQQGWGISAVTDVGDGSHLCELTIETKSDTGLDNAQITTGFYSWVKGFDSTTGGANANGRHKLTVIDLTHVVQQGTVCNGASLNGPAPNGTWVSGTNYITLDDITNVQEGERITSLSGSGIPNPSIVTKVWPLLKRAYLDQPLGATQASPVAVQFVGNSTSGLSNTCGSTGIGDTGACLRLSAAERIDAGASAGGLAAGGTGCATGYLVGGFVNVGDGNCNTGDPTAAEKVASFDLFSPVCYAMAICWHYSNAYNFRIVSSQMDASRSLHDDETSYMLLDGNFANGAIFGGQTGKVGSGLRMNITGDKNKGCIAVSGVSLDIYDFENGCGQIESTGGGGTVFVANDIRNLRLRGKMDGAEIFYEDSVAQGATDTTGTSVNLGNSTWGGHFEPGGPVPTLGVDAGTGATLASGSNDTAGRITVGTGATTITITFANMWANNPNCTLFDQTDGTVFTYVTTSGQTSVTFGPDFSSSAGDVMRYTCIGRSD